MFGIVVYVFRHANSNETTFRALFLIAMAIQYVNFIKSVVKNWNLTLPSVLTEYHNQQDVVRSNTSIDVTAKRFVIILVMGKLKFYQFEYFRLISKLENRGRILKFQE